VGENESENLILEWSSRKAVLQNRKSKIIFKQGDIWWCSIGQNLGEELFGKGDKFTRPVLIYKKFTSNSFLAIPLTKQEKRGSWYTEISMHGERRWVILNQARIMDKKRLTNRLGTLDDIDYKKVVNKLVKFYSIP